MSNAMMYDGVNPPKYIKTSPKQPDPIDAELFQDGFYKWLEANGVELLSRSIRTLKWKAEIDSDVLRIAVQRLIATECAKARLTEHVEVIKNRKELDGVGFATWSHVRRSILRTELQRLAGREVGNE